MKLIKVGTNIVGSQPDETTFDSLLEIYPGATILYVPNTIPLELEGDTYIRDPRLAMSTEEVRTCRREDIDKKTDQVLAYGFTYESSRFKMDLEHQMSYKSVFDLRAYLTFPYTIKGVGDGYLTFQNETEMTNFVLYAFSWVGDIIRNGWGLKDGLDALNKDELIAWEDPR